jgi:hypothetical protein
MEALLSIAGFGLILFFFAKLQDGKNSAAVQATGSLGVFFTMFFGVFIIIFIFMSLS